MSDVVPGLEKVQEEKEDEASSEERTAPQRVGQELASCPDSQQSSKPAVQTADKSAQQTADKSATQPAGKQDFYWRRQAEKLEKELAAARAEREAEASRLARDRDEAVSRALESEQREKRLALLAGAGLPAELTELVPEGDPETVAAYVEKLKPIAEKLRKPGARGLTNTNPPNAAGREEARLERLGTEAARGDRRALREYAHLRDKLKRTL
jgi:hypothetical protein